MQRFIENISSIDCKNGKHYNPGPNSMLIQISDPGFRHPTPAFNFKETYQFEFLDIEEDDAFVGGSSYADYKFAITDEQAKHLVDLLNRAIEKHMNVVVHCHAGIRRLVRRWK